MDFQQIRKYVKGVLTNSFLNKTTLDKLSTSDKGNLLFDGKEINNSSVEWNQIQTEGIKIAEVTIDGMATEIFAPNGGVGSGIVVDTLINATITTTNSYDFSASIDNYDMLLVTGMTHINSSDYEQLNSLIIMKDDYYIEAVDGWSHSLNFSINGSTRRVVFNFNNGKLNVVKIENAALKKIYGIKFITQQHEYSTEEKVVGKWIDGKPIYEKVIPFITTLNQSIWVETPELINDKKQILQTFGISTTSYISLMANIDRNDSAYVRIWNLRDMIIPITHVTMQYTKTTD